MADVPAMRENIRSLRASCADLERQLAEARAENSRLRARYEIVDRDYAEARGGLRQYERQLAEAQQRERGLRNVEQAARTLWQASGYLRVTSEWRALAEALTQTSPSY